jgi:hypothetical protein
MHHQLEAQTEHAPACPAVAARVQGDLALPLAEGLERAAEGVHEGAVALVDVVRGQREDRVALELLDLERGRQGLHDPGQQDTGNLGAMLELGRSHERRKP